jgi:hydrogenase expression/formation protein HypE
VVVKTCGYVRRKMIKGVLFDFDGTLTRPGALDFPAIKRAVGCPPDQPILEYLETLPSGKRSDLMKILEGIEEAAAEASIPNRGVEACLSALKHKGIFLGILTRNSIISVKKALQGFEGLTIDDFKTVITRDSSIPKPNPDGVYQAAKQMGIMPTELLVVGDFRFDVMAGKAAGAVTVLLTNDGRSVMAPDDPEPDYVVSRIKEIVGIVESLRE